MEPVRRSHATGAGALGLIFAALGGCAAEPVLPAEAELSDPGSVLHLARVEVALDADDENASSVLAISARFASARGLDESKVRARVDIPLLPQDVLEPGECVATDQLVVATDPGGAEDADDPELELIDVGDLSVEIDRTRIDVPLSLVPDLLPYMSGVEYEYAAESTPPLLAEGPRTVRLEADGSTFAGIPAFSVSAPVPVPLELSAADPGPDALDGNVLVLGWQPAGEPDESVVVRLATSVAGDRAGEEITCLFADVGRARLDLPQLRSLGLGGPGDELHAAVSRFTYRTFDVGAFQNAELVVEIRDQVTLALP